MIYLSWAALCEGASDRAYFEVLIPRLMQDISDTHGLGKTDIPGPVMMLTSRSIQQFAKEACEAKDSFCLVFVHADTGGRNLEAAIEARSCAYCAAIKDLCAWPLVRCVVIMPRTETESWLLADPAAVTAALGFTGSPAAIGLPANAREAERLAQPKAALETAVRAVRGKNRRFNVQQLFSLIAQKQSIAALRHAPSFVDFETSLHEALADLRCVRALAI